MSIRVAYTDHLVDLIVRAETVAARLARARPEMRASGIARARRESALLSARLDGSPLEDATAGAVDAGALPSPRPALPEGLERGGWATVLRLEGMPTRDITAREYANLLACFDAEEAIAGEFFDRPRWALVALHELICSGLVTPEAVGSPRVTARAVHEGAEGRMIYRAPAADAVPALLDGLYGWLGRHTARIPTLVVAGTVHERLLEWQPFEAANGRLACAASRVVLRARGLDPGGISVPERSFWADPIGYYGEVAATVRRRDLGVWLERYSEAVLGGLEAAAGIVDPCPRPAAGRRALSTIAGLPGGSTLTIAEYADRAGTSCDSAWNDLRSLAAAGLVAVDPCTHGWRYRLTS